MTRLRGKPLCACRRPLPSGAFICRDCARTLTKDLAEIPALVHELRTTFARQSRTGGASVGVTSRSSTRPLPWDDRAAKATGHLRSALVEAAQMVLHHTHRHAGPMCLVCRHSTCMELRRHQAPDNTLQATSAWLIGHVEWLRRQPSVENVMTRIHVACAQARRVTDRLPDLMYAGPCKEPLEQTGVHLGDTDPREAVGAVLCPAELYAIAGASTVTCPKCRVEHNLDARQDWLLGEVEDQLAHPALIARALSSLGRPITDSMIRGWKFRGRLIPHGLDVRGRETFRIGDVLDLLAVEVARAERNMQKRVRREERTAS